MECSLSPCSRKDSISALVSGQGILPGSSCSSRAPAMTSSRPPGATSWAVCAKAVRRAAPVSTCRVYTSTTRSNAPVQECGGDSRSAVTYSTAERGKRRRAAIDSRRRHVEGHRGEAQRRDVLGIVAQPAADHDGAPAAVDTGQRPDQALIGREVRPRHGRRALLSRRVQRLEPARVVTAGDGIRGEPPRERAARVRRRQREPSGFTNDRPPLGGHSVHGAGQPMRTSRSSVAGTGRVNVSPTGEPVSHRCRSLAICFSDASRTRRCTA